MKWNDSISQEDNWWKRFDFLFLHLVVVVLMFFLFRAFGLIELIPLNDKLLQWDTGWYNDIRSNGYIYSDVKQSNAGFYPLFPYIWRWSGLSVAGISFLNCLFSSIGIALIGYYFKFKKSELLLSLSLPSMFFLFVPYTESLFFFFTAIFLVGLKKRSFWMIWVGLLLASMTRSTGTFFLPAIIFSIALGSTKKDLNKKKNLLLLAHMVLPIIAGTLLVAIWQWMETGVWFAYFKAQSAHWYRTISLPHFPLSSWNYTEILWVDALAFLTGFLAFSLMLDWGIKWLAKDEVSGEISHNFSIAYLAILFISLLLINPKNANTGLTEISGANRYIFCSPFFFIFLQRHLKSPVVPNLILALVPLCWLLFNIYDPIYLTFFGAITFYALGFLTLSFYGKYRLIAVSVLYLSGLIMQFYLIDLYLKGHWVG